MLVFRFLVAFVLLKCTCSFLGSLSLRSGWLSRSTTEFSARKVTTPIPVRDSTTVVVVPPCPIFGSCGGCQLQNLSYSNQLALKQEFVVSALKAFNIRSPTIRSVIPASKELNYRNRAQFAIQQDKYGEAVVGLYATNSNTVVDTEKCYIQHKSVNSVLQQFRLFLKRHKPSIYNETTHTGSLRHLVVRVGFATNEVMVCVVSATPTFAHQASFLQLMKLVPNVKSILLHYNPIPGDQVLQDTKLRSDVRNGSSVSSSAAKTSPKTVALSGRDYILETTAGINVKVSLNSFLQSNPLQTTTLYEQVLRCIENSTMNASGVSHTSIHNKSHHGTHTVAPISTTNSSRTVWDLYCGVGTIGMFLSKSACVSNVIGVESSVDAVRDARHNAKINNIQNIEFVGGLVEDIIVPDGARQTCLDNNSTMEVSNSTLPSLQTDDVVVLNPPRKGCHQSLLTTLRRSGASTIVYISCNPKTLARDLQLLTTGSTNSSSSSTGTSSSVYEIKSIQPVDMFPQTVHIETVVWLERVK